MTRMRLTWTVAAGLALVAMLVVGVRLSTASHHAAPAKLTATPGDTDSEAQGLSNLESYWNDRLTYPTGHFNPAWMRRAARQAAKLQARIPVANGKSRVVRATQRHGRASGPRALTPGAGFISLGPKPERMTGCSGCFDYTTTEGRVNAIAVDPTTTTNGSIVAYLASVGGGVWKTTNCCSSSTTWSPMTDDPLLSTISVDTLAIDPANHNTVYAGTGDLNYGSFSMGSQGILKSTNAGTTWTVLGSNVFGPAYSEPAGQFPQYDAVGKVRVDPNNSNRVVAGTKKGLFLSYDGGANWTGPCVTNSFATQRQDITGLELSNMGGGTTRVLAAVGTRGFATPVQYDLDQNGANGIYSATMPSSGCPTFSSIAGNANGFNFGTSVSGSPYSTGANMNAGSGNRWVSATSGNQLGRIDLGVAPSNPNVIYAQVGSITPNNNSGCTNTNGCQLGAWVTTNGGTSWSFMAGSAGGSLQACGSGAGSGSSGSGDYPQNWYDQGVAVDPNNPDRVYFDTFDVWLATRTGTHWYDTTCGYTGVSPKPVHVDQHALAFVPGSSSILLLGNDGGTHGTTNAQAAVDNTTRPTWFNMDSGLNTIEFYSGDISANFATAANPQAAGGAQDNMNSFVTFSGTPTGPAQWQGNVGGDGFFAHIDGKGGFFYASNNNGALHRCTANCSNSGGVFGGEIRNATMQGDRQSFVEPFDIFKGNPGGTGNAECGTRCNHIVVGSFRVWENTAADTGTTWTARSGDLTKNTLGNRSYINNLHYAPQNQTLLIVATNDGNVQLGYGLGGTSTFVNVTGSNAVLPNRPILDAVFDPASQNTAGNPMVGYASVGGFNANTPGTPGHVFRVSCTVNCASFSWQDKSGNLPDIPVDSIAVNPRFPQQVFAGTDFGLYFTDNINDASPTWYRFQTGLPNVMIWDLQIDRGNTTLSAWTRSRGAYAWALPNERVNKLDQTIDFPAIPDHAWGDPDFAAGATASSGLNVSYSASGNCTVNGAGTIHITNVGSCSVTASQAGDGNYKPATNVTRSFTIKKGDQAIDFAALNDAIFGDADFGIMATATSGLTVSLIVDSGSCTVMPSTSPASVHLYGAGMCTIRASQGGNSLYNPAPDIVRTFSIARANQTITFDPLADVTYGDPDFDVFADASSGLDTSFTALGQCTITGNTVHIDGGGSCTVTASQLGDSNWNPAPDMSQTFTINRAAQEIDFGPLADKTYGDADFDVSASASSGLDVSFSATGNCTVSGSSVHITGAGSCSVTASQPGDSNYLAADDASQTFAIAKANQTIDFGTLGDATFGDPDFAVEATATSGLGVSFAVTAGPCTLSSPTSPSSVHLNGAGSCTIVASQGGDANYNGAPDEMRTFSVHKANQTIDFGPLADKTYLDPDFGVSATASSGLGVSFDAAGNCTIAGSTVHITGGGSCTVTASQVGDGNYNPAPDVSRTFAIHKAGQTIDFPAVSDKPYGADFYVSATATSGLTVSFSASGKCTVAGTTVHPTGAGTCTLTASQGGDSNYEAAANVTRSLSILVTLSKQAVLAEVQATMSTATRHHDYSKLKEAAKKLTESLDPKYWIDGNHLVVKQGEHVFDKEKEAVQKLRELLKDKHSGISDASLMSWINTLVVVDGNLAQIAIDEAYAGNPRKLAEAAKDMQKAGKELAKGHYDEAIERYKQAWKKAAESLKH